MPYTHITINYDNEESSTQTIGTSTTEMAPEDNKQRTPAKLNQNFVSRISRTLSLDSSILAMPSMNTNTSVHKYLGISRSSSGASSDLYFPGYLGHKGNDDKLPLHGGLRDPIWVTPKICPHHQPTNGEMCSMCKKDGGNRLEKPEPTPDFTVLNVYDPREPAKKCQCGTISTLTNLFLILVSLIILALVVLCEGIKK